MARSKASQSLRSHLLRSPADRADQGGKAAAAAETAVSTSEEEASWTSAMCLRLEGLVSGKVLVGLLEETNSPLMKRRVSRGLLVKSVVGLEEPMATAVLGSLNRDIKRGFDEEVSDSKEKSLVQLLFGLKGLIYLVGLTAAHRCISRWWIRLF